MTPPVGACVLTALYVSVMTAGAQTQRPPELKHVEQLGQALAEYSDGVTQAVAAYYYSQRHHDSRWLLVEFGFYSRQPVDLVRDRITLVTPAGDVVPLAAQRAWGDDAQRARQLLQEAQPTRHQVASYFNKQIASGQLLRFFGRPEQGQTVFDTVSTSFDRVLLGDLLFESPTGAWARGRHILVVGLDEGEIAVPIDLR